MRAALIPVEMDADPRPARKLAIALLLVSALVAGVAEEVHPALANLSIGFLPLRRVVTTALAYWWYWADSKITGYERSKWLDVGVLALPLLGVLYYAVRSRRGWGRLRIALAVIGVAVLALALNQLGGRLPSP